MSPSFNVLPGKQGIRGASPMTVPNGHMTMSPSLSQGNLNNHITFKQFIEHNNRGKHSNTVAAGLETSQQSYQIQQNLVSPISKVYNRDYLRSQASSKAHEIDGFGRPVQSAATNSRLQEQNSMPLMLGSSMSYLKQGKFGSARDEMEDPHHV